VAELHASALSQGVSVRFCGRCVGDRARAHARATDNELRPRLGWLSKALALATNQFAHRKRQDKPAVSEDGNERRKYTGHTTAPQKSALARGNGARAQRWSWDLSCGGKLIGTRLTASAGVSVPRASPGFCWVLMGHRGKLVRERTKERSFDSVLLLIAVAMVS